RLHEEEQGGADEERQTEIKKQVAPPRGRGLTQLAWVWNNLWKRKCREMLKIPRISQCGTTLRVVSASSSRRGASCHNVSNRQDARLELTSIFMPRGHR